MVSESRLKTAELKSQGKTREEILDLVPEFNSLDSVSSALQNADVKEQIAFHRDNLFYQSRIDRVQLLKELHARATEPTGPIFKVLRGEGNFLDAANLEKLTPLQSRLIQQIEIEPTFTRDNKGKTITVSVVKKIRFHSPDSALKILSKAAGFEDGILSVDPTEIGGPFRGLVIIPPRQPLIDTKRSGEGPPETPVGL